MKLPCKLCGHVHAATDAIAIGRFDPNGVIGYSARFLPNAPLRDTREKAMNDACAWRIKCKEIDLEIIGVMQ